MHKSLFNEAFIKLTIEPAGPILIKAGEGASDPTKPDMSFVRTMRDSRETVYLPGSSLKGVLRAHCERIARTVQGSQKLSCVPLSDESCSDDIEKLKTKWEKDNKQKLPASEIQKQSCFVCRMFGHTSLASHFRISDAYTKPDSTAPMTEERNGVAIDRVFGSALRGALFNYETVTSGQFQTTIQIKNFTLAQLGLLSLTLRDLAAERVRLGFGKSRGLGAVTAHVDEMNLRYPACEVKDGKLKMLGGAEISEEGKLVGVGKFIEKLYGEGAAAQYGYKANDEINLPPGHSYKINDWEEVEVRAPKDGDKAEWEGLGRACAARWKLEAQS